MTQATPLRKQYLEIKRRHTNAILLFRIGDFYEAFDDDARVLARDGIMYLSTAPYLSFAGAHLPRLRVPVPLHLLVVA